MVIRAGKLRHWVEFQKLGEPAGSNKYGEPDQAWHTVLATWAEISPIVGKEYFAVQQTQSSVTARIRIRYSPSVEITSDMRILKGGSTDRVFHIVGPPINPMERNQELVLMCTEKV